MTRLRSPYAAAVACALALAGGGTAQATETLRAGLGASASGWRPYLNGRFGFGMEYPDALMRAQPEADNGDGRHFLARRGHADASAWGGYNALEQTPAQMADDTQRECAGGRAAYRAVWRDGAVVSCPLAGGRVLYKRTWLRRDVESTLRITYPAAERAVWDPVIARMSRTFRPGAGLD